SISNKVWEEQGIIGWKSFLKYCGLSWTYRSKLTEEELDAKLEQLRKEMVEEEKKGKKLRRGDYCSISYLIQKKTWTKKGITTWQEFLAYCGINYVGRDKISHLTSEEKELWLKLKEKMYNNVRKRGQYNRKQAITRKEALEVLIKWETIPEEILLEVAEIFGKMVILGGGYSKKEITPILILLVRKVYGLKRVNLSFAKLKELSEKAGYSSELKIVTIIKAEERIDQLKSNKLKKRSKKSLKEKIGEELQRLEKEMGKKGFKEKKVFKRAVEELERGNYMKIDPRKGAITLVMRSYSKVKEEKIVKVSRMMHQILEEESVEVMRRRVYRSEYDEKERLKIKVKR
ncbi:MAG: hypothetical protein ACTSYA_09335, partial [Candidatus Kariarchaeaceae archaeon]